jgi:hypothetical protein
MAVLRRIRADDRHNAIPVVVLSTSDNVHDINLWLTCKQRKSFQSFERLTRK